MTWNVNLWHSHPDDGNDDCETGREFATEVEARDWAARLLAGESPYTSPRISICWTHLEIDGPDANEVIAHPTRRPATKDELDEEWRREIAMEVGMLHGVEAYNDYMGYSDEVLS